MVIDEDIDDGVDLWPLSGGASPLQAKVASCPRNSRPDSGQLVFLETAICSKGLVAASEVQVTVDYSSVTASDAIGTSCVPKPRSRLLSVMIENDKSEDLPLAD